MPDSEVNPKRARPDLGVHYILELGSSPLKWKMGIGRRTGKGKFGVDGATWEIEGEYTLPE